MRFLVNQGLDPVTTDGAFQGISAHPLDEMTVPQAFSGDFRIRFDAWMNVRWRSFARLPGVSWRPVEHRCFQALGFMRLEQWTQSPVLQTILKTMRIPIMPR
jgi:hypothetical protein